MNLICTVNKPHQLQLGQQSKSQMVNMLFHYSSIQLTLWCGHVNYVVTDLWRTLRNQMAVLPYGELHTLSNVLLTTSLYPFNCQNVVKRQQSNNRAFFFLSDSSYIIHQMNGSSWSLEKHGKGYVCASGKNIYNMHGVLCYNTMKNLHSHPYVLVRAPTQVHYRIQGTRNVLRRQ